jgi:hypothetical protein
MKYHYATVFHHGDFMNCYICGNFSVKRHGRANRCEKHHRFTQMQRTAKQDQKYVPSIFELEKLVPHDMKCQDCGVVMHWIDDENRSSGAVLQHYRDGSLGIVCHACNVKHGNMPGDSYREVPPNHKLCRSCKTIKPLSMFGIRKDGKVPYPTTKCKSCRHQVLILWRKNNPEKYKLINKKHNDLRGKR